MWFLTMLIMERRDFKSWSKSRTPFDRSDGYPRKVVGGSSNCPTLEKFLRPVQLATNYLGVSLRFASSCTDFVVADFAITDLVDEPHAAGGFVICLANKR